MKTKNTHAQALSALANGVKKNFTPEDRQRRRELMQRINAERKLKRSVKK